MQTGSSSRFGQNVALLIFLVLLILAPRPLAGWLDLASARRFEAAGDPASAAVEYASAARRLVWRADLWEQAGLAALEAGQPEEAIPYLENASENLTLSVDGCLALGDAWAETGELPAAMAAWQKCSMSGLAYERMAQAHRGMGDYPAALQDLRTLVTLEPQAAHAHYELALFLAAADPQSALPELIRAAQLDSSLNARVEPLRLSLNTALLSDDEPYRFLLAGRALGARDEWDLAAEAFRRSVLLRPDYAAGWAWLGEAKQHLGQDGGPDMEQALQLDPASAMINTLYGMYWQRQGQAQKALQAFQTAVKLEPETASWRVALGSAYEQTGGLTQAVAEYLRAVELDPQDASAWQALALFSVTNGYDLAGTGLWAAQTLLKLAPDDWSSHDVAGQVTFALGNIGEAQHQYKEAINLAPGQPGPHLHLALVYLECGERLAAQDELEAARSLDPDGPVGWQAGRLLEGYFP